MCYYTLAKSTVTKCDLDLFFYCERYFTTNMNEGECNICVWMNGVLLGTVLYKADL